MAYSSLYEDNARQEIRINPFEELRVTLEAYRKRGINDVYVLGLPRSVTVPDKSTQYLIEIGDCIDVIMLGRKKAEQMARRFSASTTEPIPITIYHGQTPAKLQSELDVAKILATEQKKKFFFYTEETPISNM